jgi:hypothetical protein
LQKLHFVISCLPTNSPISAGRRVLRQCAAVNPYWLLTEKEIANFQSNQINKMYNILIVAPQKIDEDARLTMPAIIGNSLMFASIPPTIFV